MMIKTNITYNIEEAREYYKILTENYQHLHWFYEKDHNNPNVIDPKNKLHSMHGWGLQTIYNDTSFPYHCDIDPHTETYNYFKDTELVFGFFKRVTDFFTNPYRSFVFVHPPGNTIGKWKAGGRPHYRVIIPIYASEDSGIITYKDSNTIDTVTHPEPGNIYIFNPKLSETFNKGTTDDVAIVFNIPIASYELIKDISGVI